MFPLCPTCEVSSLWGKEDDRPWPTVSLRLENSSWETNETLEFWTQKVRVQENPLKEN